MTLCRTLALIMIQKNLLKADKKAPQIMMMMIKNTKYKGHTSLGDYTSKKITENTTKKELEGLKQWLVNA